MCGGQRAEGCGREVVSMWLGIRRPKTAEGGWERKESFRLAGCIKRAGLVP